MNETALGFHVQGVRVSGTIHLPSGTNKVPAVVMCHGFTGSKLEAHFIFVKTARALAAAGIAAYRFDFRCSGESGGSFQDMTITGEIADALKAVSQISRHRRIDSKRLGLLGLSLGGLVAANAATRETKIRSLALWCPVADPAHSLKRIREWGGTTRREGKVLDIGGLGLGPAFFRNPGKLDPVSALQKCRRPFPIFILKGEADTTISMEENSLLIKGLRYSTHPVKQVVIAAAGHTFERLDHERMAIRATVDWFNKTL